MQFTTHLHLVPRLGMSGPIPLLPLYAFKVWKGMTILYSTNPTEHNIKCVTVNFNTRNTCCITCLYYHSKCYSQKMNSYLPGKRALHLPNLQDWWPYFNLEATAFILEYDAWPPRLYVWNNPIMTHTGS